MFGGCLNDIAPVGIGVRLRSAQMTIAELIEILKTYDLNAVVVLADSAGEQGKRGVARLRADEIQSAHSRDSGVF